MSAQQPTVDGVVILVFPFAAHNVFTIAKKVGTVISEVALNPVLVTGGIPGNLVWPDSLEVLDIGIRMHYVKDKQPLWLSTLSWIVKFLVVQVRFALCVVRFRNEIETIVCFLGGYYQLPILIARLLGKRVLTGVTGIDERYAKVDYGRIIPAVIGLLSRFNYHLSHVLIVESLRLGDTPELAPFRHKLRNGALYLEDALLCRDATRVSERENTVGFIGRFSSTKGILEFIAAIPLALERKPDLRFLLLGRGKLDDAVRLMIDRSPFSSRIEQKGWVEHSRIAEYINRMKLLVIPSFEEGLPNIALEAMGCGTPVLAARVGGLADLIDDGVTGFCLTDHTPFTIGRSIVDALNNPDIEAVARRGRQVIKRSYSLQAARHRYERIFLESASSTAADSAT